MHLEREMQVRNPVTYFLRLMYTNLAHDNRMILTSILCTKIIINGVSVLKLFYINLPLGHGSANFSDYRPLQGILHHSSTPTLKINL